MVIEGAIGPTKYVHLDVPIHIFTVKKRFYKVRLPVRYVDKDCIGFENTKDLLHI